MIFSPQESHQVHTSHDYTTWWFNIAMAAILAHWVQRFYRCLHIFTESQTWWSWWFSSSMTHLKGVNFIGAAKNTVANDARPPGLGGRFFGPRRYNLYDGSDRNQKVDIVPDRWGRGQNGDPWRLKLNGGTTECVSLFEGCQLVMGVPQQLDGLFHGKFHRSKWMIWIDLGVPLYIGKPPNRHPWRHD